MNILDKPTYVMIVRIGEDLYLNETKIGATLMSVVEMLESGDTVEAVHMIEDFKVVDVTAEVAWAWYNAFSGQPFFEDIALPDIVQEHCGNAYHDWCNDSRYETEAQRAHENGLGHAARYL